MFHISKQSFLPFSILIAVSLATGWFLIEKTNETKETFSSFSFTPTVPTFDSYNKTLSRNKITGVKDLEGPYKKVTVSNNEITFSFEVPDNWLTETRNSGEVEMNEEELREFLGTKWERNIKTPVHVDAIVHSLGETDYVSVSVGKNLENILKSGDTAIFPVASVSYSNSISYVEQNIYQVDFVVLSSYKIKDLYQKSLKSNSVYYDECVSSTVSNLYNSNTHVISCRYRNLDLESKTIYMSLKEKNKGLRINMDSYSLNDEIKKNLDNIIKTLTFE